MASLTSYNSKLSHEYDSSFPPSRNKVGDAEIDIFSADKYFNGNMDEDNSRKANLVARRRYQDNKTELIHGDSDIKPRIEARTPSSYSESSWNSQSALLRRQRIQSKTKAKVPKKKFFASYLGCNCACSDKNSVDVENYGDYYKQNAKDVVSLDQADLIGIKSLSFSVVNKAQSLQQQQQQQQQQKQQQQQQQEEERKSIEVFGSSSSQDNGSRRFSLEKRMSMLAWDAIQAPASGGDVIRDKDTESEASSDLFEIECLSCSENPVVNRQSSCVSPTNGYAPSEASVEWSVITASAAEFSVLSDSEEQGSSVTTAAVSHKMLPPRPRQPASPKTELSKTRYGGILSGCSSQKAVRVAGNVYSAETRVKRSDSFRNVMQFQMDTSKNPGFGSKYRKDMLYIQ